MCELEREKPIKTIKTNDAWECIRAHLCGCVCVWDKTRKVFPRQRKARFFCVCFSNFYFYPAKSCSCRMDSLVVCGEWFRVKSLQTTSQLGYLKDRREGKPPWWNAVQSWIIKGGQQKGFLPKSFTQFWVEKCRFAVEINNVTKHDEAWYSSRSPHSTEWFPGKRIQLRWP